MKEYWRLSVCIVLLAALVATVPALPAGPVLAATGVRSEYLKITDDADRTVVLQRKPKRIVVLSPSFLELLYAVGGKAVGRPNSTAELDSLPKEGRKLPEVGFVYNINIEKVAALQPDLVIAMAGMHNRLVPIFESNRLPVLVLKYKTYDDVFAKITLFGQIAGVESKAAATTRAIKTKLKQIIAKIPAQPYKIAILHATAKSVSLELENSIAGNTAKLLRLRNITAGSGPAVGDADTIPYSLERLVASDPDLIFVVTMGKATEIAKTMSAEVENNPAWSTLRAVRNKKVIFLPSELFLLNPGIRIPETAAYMAKLVYPGVYGSGE